VNKAKDIVFDMETGDPDDFMTLLLLLGHPRSNLKAVTVTPGTREQVGLVRWACQQLNPYKHVPVGAFDPDRDKKCVSSWHYEVYGQIPSANPDARGGEILRQCCDENTTLVTGAPLKNVGVAMDLGFKVGRWVAQGGFAGEGVVPPERQLEKFKGMVTCPTYNLNGDPKSALRALEYDGIGHRRFVSKNVCHGVVADRPLVDRVGAAKAPHMKLIHKGMEAYLSKGPVGKGSGKKLHDPLAACCALSPEIGEWAEVRLFREKGQWGSALKPGSGTLIITGYRHDRFVETLTEV
jgi:pyrimidine-specific ribonucleoside hydrolase